MTKEKLCKHLMPILDTELSLGNAIEKIDEVGPLEEGVEFEILLERRLNLIEIKKMSLPIFVQEWECDDTHYSANGEHGFFCKKCQHEIKGPL